MKKNSVVIALCCLCAFAGSLLPAGRIEASGTPGSSADPLVTKSYVDQKFAELSGLMSGSGQGSAGAYTKDQIIEEVLAKIGFYYPNGVSGTAFTPVLIQAGEVMIGHEGAEIILRSGQAAAYVGVENGISNITSGKELYNNDQIGINNLLIIPKYDARGVKAITDAWFIVKGGYDIN